MFKKKSGNQPQYFRCRVADVMKNEFPNKANAWLLSCESLGAKVLIDGAETADFYNWGWIKFEKGVTPLGSEEKE